MISKPGNWVVIYNKRIAQVETFEAIGNCQWKKVQDNSKQDTGLKIQRTVIQKRWRGRFQQFVWNCDKRYYVDPGEIQTQSPVGNRIRIHGGYWEKT